MGMTKEAAAKLLQKDPDYFSRRGRKGGATKRQRNFDDPTKAREAANLKHHKEVQSGEQTITG